MLIVVVIAIVNIVIDIVIVFIVCACMHTFTRAHTWRKRPFHGKPLTDQATVSSRSCTGEHTGEQSAEQAAQSRGQVGL